jgi:septum formation protein
MKKLILASASPWRKKILTKAGFKFSVEESGYREDMSQKLSPRVLARTLALGKARKVAVRHQEAVILGADTFAVFRGELLGKPHTPKRAVAMLKMLSGKTHVLLTGFAIVDAKTNKSVTKVVATRVTMKKLSDEVIKSYVATGEPLKAAGAYVIQGNGAKLMKKTEGDVNNIAGLPIFDVVRELKKFAISAR